MVTSRPLQDVSSVEWAKIRQHHLHDSPFKSVLELCPYITISIQQDCLFAIVPQHQHNYESLSLCIIAKPDRPPPICDKDLWERMESEAWNIIQLKPKNNNH